MQARSNATRHSLRTGNLIPDRVRAERTRGFLRQRTERIVANCTGEEPASSRSRWPRRASSSCNLGWRSLRTAAAGRPEQGFGWCSLGWCGLGWCSLQGGCFGRSDFSGGFGWCSSGWRSLRRGGFGLDSLLCGGFQMGRLQQERLITGASTG